MNEFNQLQTLKDALKLASEKIEEEVEKSLKIQKALKKVFPLEVYKELRPDVKTDMDDDDDLIINHFVEFGINETDLEEEANRASWFLAEQITQNILTDCRSVLKKEQEQDNDRHLVLSKTFGSHASLRENKYHNFAKAFTITHPKSKTICTWIPKNACSTLRFSFAKANGLIRSKNEIEWIHSNNESFCADDKELINASYTFTILRDPLERILSYFLDKICHPDGDTNYDKSYSHARKTFKTNNETTFNTFIESIYINPRLILEDIHIVPQCKFLVYEKYDDYFSLEKMEDAKLKIHAKTGIQLEDTREFNNIYTTKGLQFSETIGPQTPIEEIANYLKEGLKPHPDKMLLPSLVKKILPLYLGDIVLYGSVIDKGFQKMSKWIDLSDIR